MRGRWELRRIDPRDGSFMLYGQGPRFLTRRRADKIARRVTGRGLWPGAIVYDRKADHFHEGYTSPELAERYAR